MKGLLLSATFIVLALSIEALSQSEQPALKPATPQVTNQTRSSFVLEIAYNLTLPPAYITIAGNEKKPGWIWVTRFNHLVGWQYPEGVLPIKAVKFEAQYNGETADVRVTVLRGRKHFEQEELVDSYQVGLDEPRNVTKLQEFGIEAARITLLNPIPVQPVWPEVTNNTSSITIEKISMANDSLPGYNVVFHNQSNKRLAALRVDVAGGQHGPISALLQGEDGRALIEPGRSAEQYLHAITEVVANPRAPVLPAPSTIVIRSAVFVDGTYEGDIEPACSFEGYQLGRKIWLETVLPLFDVQSSETSLEAHEAAAELKQRVTALDLSFQASVSYSSKVSTKCVKTGSLVELTVKNQKLQLLRELDKIITTRPAPPINFKSWLQTTADRYRAWLARL